MAGAFTISGKVEGLEAVTAALQTIKRGPRNRILRRMVRAANAVVLAAARRRAQGVGQSKVIEKSLIQLVRTYRGGSAVVGVVGPDKARTQTVPVWSWYIDKAGKVKRFVPRKTNPSNILHLVEFGTKPHAIGKGSSLRKGAQHGRVHPGSRPRPIMQPAWDESKDAARDAMLEKAAEGIKAEAGRLAR